MVGVRRPMHEAEEPAIRPYWLASYIRAAFDTAVSNGAQVVHPPLKIPGRGSFAIYSLDENR